VYVGDYAQESWGDAVARRTPEEEAHHQSVLGGDAGLRASAATLFRPRPDLEAALRPAAPRLLEPSEGAAFWGPTVHAGAGTAAGVWRCILFWTAHVDGEDEYDTDTQVLPFTAALDLYHSALLGARTASEYADLSPADHFTAAGVRAAVAQQTAPPAALARVTTGRAAR
jgi:hypothetical protein